MRPFEDPTHEGNSNKYHTGKKCTCTGCKEPAGTWWSPVLCFTHNVARLRRIDDSLNDVVKAAEIHALIHKETEDLRRWAYDMNRTMKAMVLAAGGKLTIKNADKDRNISSESVQYGDTTTTFLYHPSRLKSREH